MDEEAADKVGIPIPRMWDFRGAQLECSGGPESMKMIGDVVACVYVTSCRLVGISMRLLRGGNIPESSEWRWLEKQGILDARMSYFVYWGGVVPFLQLSQDYMEFSQHIISPLQLELQHKCSL